MFFQVHSSPILTESNVYLGSNSKKVFSLDRSSGEIEWYFETKHDVKAPGVVADDILYIGSYDKHIYALNTSTGNPLWNYTTVSAVRIAPVSGAGGKIFFGSRAGVVYCLNSVTGEVKWTYETGLDIGHPLVIGNKRVFAASNNHRLYCFKTKNGRKVWEFDTGGEVVTGAVLDGKGKVFIGSASSILYAVHEANGTLIWSCNHTNSPLMGELLVQHDMLYVTTADNVLHALQTSSGSHVWSYYDSNVNNNVSITHYMPFLLLISTVYFYIAIVLIFLVKRSPHHTFHCCIVAWSDCNRHEWSFVFWRTEEFSLCRGWKRRHAVVVILRSRQCKCHNAGPCHLYMISATCAYHVPVNLEHIPVAMNTPLTFF